MSPTTRLGLAVAGWAVAAGIVVVLLRQCDPGAGESVPPLDPTGHPDRAHEATPSSQRATDGEVLSVESPVADNRGSIEPLSRGDVGEDTQLEVVDSVITAPPGTPEYHEWFEKLEKYYILNGIKNVSNRDFSPKTRANSGAGLVCHSLTVILSNMGRFEEIESGVPFMLPSADDPSGDRGFAQGMRRFRFHTTEFPQFDLLESTRNNARSLSPDELEANLLEALHLAHSALAQLEHVPLITLKQE